MAPHDWVENTFAWVLPVALKLFVRKGAERHKPASPYKKFHKHHSRELDAGG
jgi:hypothetical protein